MNILKVIEGAVKSVLNIDSSIAAKRIELACKKCFASHKNGKYTGWCLKRNGGCGCNTDAKARTTSFCPMGVWTEDDDINLDKLEEINKLNKFEQ